MTMRLPEEPVLWFIDWDDRLLKLLVEIAHETAAFQGVQSFQKTRPVRQLLSDESSSVHFPWIVVSDRIGVDDSPSGEISIAKLLRTNSPLTMFLLHSNSAYEDPGFIPDLRRKRLVDESVSKTISREDLASLIKRWYDRWSSPTVTKMRDYIRDCSHPNLQYFPDGDGGFLTVADIYREIVAGSEFGMEAEKVWDPILSDSPSHA